MLEIMGKRILPEKSRILYDKPFTDENLAKDWEIASGEWWIEDGWLTGRIYEDGGGLIYSRNSYPGDIMLDFYGRFVPPCANDLNFTWCSQGWDYDKKDAGIGYIAGFNGWWAGKTGVEKYPECNLQATTTTNFPNDAVYHIQAGMIQGLCFIFINGKLIIELRDPAPLDSSIYGRIGFGVYCSHIQVKDFKLYRPAWENESKSYTPQF